MDNIFKFLLLCILFVCFCSACNSFNADEVKNNSCFTENINENKQDITINELKNPQIVAENEFYKVLKGDGNYYYYYIFDKQKNVVNEKGFYWNEPELSVVENCIVKVRIHQGTGIGALCTRYYDSNADLLSEWFNGVYDEADNLVVFSDHKKLIVQNIFDKTVYYKEITDFTYELIDIAEPFTDVSFINNGTRLSVTYKTYDLIEKTEIVSLY